METSMFAQSTPQEHSQSLSVIVALVPIWDTSECTRILPRTGEFTCGSDDTCDVHVSLKGVAPRHCRISCHNGFSTVVPMSGHRIWVNNVLVTEPERLRNGDALAVGPATYRVDCRHDASFAADVSNTATSSSPAVVQTPQSASPASGPAELLKHIQELENRIATAESAVTTSIAPTATPAGNNFAAHKTNPMLNSAPATPNGSSAVLMESAATLNARELRLQELESELDRRSEMLQQQLSMFKHRQKQFFESVAATEAQQENDKRISEAEADQLLTNARERAARMDAAAKKKTAELGRQSQALQRKHRGIETAHADIVEQKKTLQRSREQLESDRIAQLEAHASSKAELDAQIAEVNATYAEVNRLADDAKTSQRRIQKRELELKNFDEELQHRHDELKKQTEQLNESIREVAQQTRDHDAAQAAFEADSLSRQSKLKQHSAALNEQAVALQKQADRLLQSENKVREQTAELQVQQGEFAASQKQHAEEVEISRSELRLQRENIDAEQALIKQASTRISQAEADLNVRDEELAATARQLAMTAEQLEQQSQIESNELAKASLKIATLEAEVQKNADEYSKLQATLASENTADELAAPITANDEKEAELTIRQAELETQRACLAELQCRLDDQTAEINAAAENRLLAEADWNRSCAESNAELEARQAELTELAEGLVQQQTKLDVETRNHHTGTEALQTLAAEVRAKTAQNEARDRELEAWEIELEARHNETAQRVQLLKKLNAAAISPSASTATSLSVAESHKFAEQLEAARRETEKLTAERDQLVIAVRELKVSFQDTQAELEKSLASGDSDALLIKLTDQNNTLMQREAELQTVRADLETISQQNSILEAQLRVLTEQMNTELAEMQQPSEAAAVYSSEDCDWGDEMELMRQVEELTAEFASHANVSTNSSSGFSEQVSAYEQTIRDLNLQLAETLDAANQQIDFEDQSRLLSVIAELKERIEQQDRQINELIHTTQKLPTAADAAETVGELQMLHKELDERTVVLDNREDRIRERTRQLEQSEEEIETQRRQLLEARQQLELARADLQVAMNTQKPESDIPLPELRPATHPEHKSKNLSKDDKLPAVRAEIAELFGIKVSDVTDEEVTPNLESLLPAVDEYSQESAPAVSMSFSRPANILLTPDEKANTSPDDAVPVDDGDDFVASYMEKLLARNREKAGGSLPNELKYPSSSEQTNKDSQHRQAANSTQEQTSPSKAEKGKAAGQKSFIAAYTSGEYDSGDSPPSTVAPFASTQGESRKSSPRAKMDLNSLRINMDSFRELSTRSVENALPSHTKRQQQGGITARSTVLVSLCAGTVFMGVAAAIGVVAFGLPIWLLIFANFTSGAELFYKLYSVKTKVKKSAVTLTKRANQDGSVSLPAARPAAPPRPAASLDMAPNSGSQLPAAGKSHLTDHIDARRLDLAGNTLSPSDTGGRTQSPALSLEGNKEYFEK